MGALSARQSQEHMVVPLEQHLANAAFVAPAP
jgi:hypothetical protein